MKYLCILIPIVSALLFRFGGSDQWEWCPLNQKLWRWLMGIAVGALAWHGLWSLLIVTGTYFLATNLFGYGDKTPILKYLPQNIKHLVSGLIFGLASIPLLGWIAVIQALVSTGIFYVVETKKINNPWAEWLRGGIGTILYPALAFL